MTDVEMSSLTPPSHRVTNLRAHVVDQGEELADDSMTNMEAHSNNASSRTTRTDAAATPPQHVRRKRSVLSRKGKRLAHLQSRELVPSSRGLPSNQSGNDDEDSYGTEESGEEDEEDDEDLNRRRGTPSRIRSITKYAVNYILPNSVAPISHQPMASSSSAVHYMDKPELLLGYAQLIFNASILTAFLYLLFNVVRTVQRDVAEKVRAYEMGKCQDYLIVSCPRLQSRLTRTFHESPT